MFIRQSMRSDYCAVYATGMLLTLLGVETRRADAMRLFNARPGTWRGATQQQIANIVNGAVPGLVAVWRRKRPRTASGFVDMAQSSFLRRLPLLVTARCRHRRLGITCGHVFLITDTNDSEAMILDPLGSLPRTPAPFNAVIRRSTDMEASLVKPDTLAWDIDLARSISVLVFTSAPEKIRAQGQKGPT